MLLGASDQRLCDDLGYAEDRYAKHLRNECGRAEGGLPSDLERYLKTGDCWD